MEFLNHNYKNPEKAKHWLRILDNIRAKGELDELPEALRKCQKHAPGRRVLLETVLLEHEIAKLSTREPQPPSANAALNRSLITIEQVVRPNIRSKEEDVWQAKITQGFAALWIGRYEMVSNLVSYKLDEELAEIVGENGVRQTQTYVCLAKGAYARGVALVKTNTREAVKWFEKMLHVLDTQVPSEWQTDGFQMWYERFLASYCILVGHIVRDNRSEYSKRKEGDFLVQPSAILTPFRAWSKFINGFVSYRPTQQRFMPYDKEATREIVWRLSYNTISVIVQDGFETSVFKNPIEAYKMLRNTQHNYHEIVATRNKFPPANSTTPKMEEWVFQITANWKAIMQADWCDSVIKQENRLEFSEKLVDLLEQAVCLTFQSSRIYRNLVIAFTSTGKINMVKVALQRYVDLIKKESLRNKSSSIPGPYIDNHGIALMTLSMGMEALCTYGNFEEVKYAHDLVNTALAWFEKYAVVEDSNQADKIKTQHLVSSRAHRAIGLSRATWAKFTPFTEEREILLESAVSHYQRSVSQEFGDPTNPLAHYLLASALIDISMENDHTGKAGTAIIEAIGLLHAVLHENPDSISRWRNESVSIEGTRSAACTLLLKCWHLLALLVLHDGRHVDANKVIETAFRPYGGDELLKGLNLAASLATKWSTNEKRRLVELKMTQICITLDRNDGPEGAQNAMPLCLELTKLYALLFNEQVEQESPKIHIEPAPPTQPATSPPSSSRKSLRKSLLHLPRDNISQAKIAASPAASSETSPPRQSNNAILPHLHGFLGRRESKKLQKRPSQRSVDARGQSGTGSSHPTNEPVTPVKNTLAIATQPPEGANKPTSGVPYSIDDIGIAVTHDFTPTPRISLSSLRSSESRPHLSGEPPPSSNPISLREILSAGQNMDETNPNAEPKPPEPPKESKYEKYPYIHNELNLIHVPEPQYPKDILTRRADAFLSSVWLCVASVYRQAQMFSDAIRCVGESKKCVDLIWQRIGASHGLSDRITRQPGYGGLKSCGELTADNLAEKAQVLFEQASWADLSGESKDKLRAEATVSLNRALELCPDHLGATLVQSAVLLAKYQPFYDAKMGVDPEIAPIGPGDGHWPLQNGTKTALGNINEASADRDLAIYYLNSLVSSSRGFASLAAWQMLGQAREFVGDDVGAEKAALMAVNMSQGAYLIPSIVLENLS